MTGTGPVPGQVRRVVAPASMSEPDRQLLDRAQDLLERVWTDGRHEVAAALRTVGGTLVTGVHVEGSCRRSSVCAEGVALGAARAAIQPDRPLDVAAVVAVQIKPAGQFRVIAPCGVCRELISDYSPGCLVWLTAGDDVVARPAIDLLPDKTRRAW